MDVALLQDDVIPQLWNAYIKTEEYRHKEMRRAIPRHHLLVENQEREGLRDIYQRQIRTLQVYRTARLELKERTVGQWLDEWKEMHRLLFRHILRECGDWRKISVRFGDPADEEQYRIPAPLDVPREMDELAHQMPEYLSGRALNRDGKYHVLAQLHFQFVRIHPFSDGNGRIARAITDQVAIYFGLPVAVAGYPRHNPKRRESYHSAIRACIIDPGCEQLSLWIGGYINEQLKRLA